MKQIKIFLFLIILIQFQAQSNQYLAPKSDLVKDSKLNLEYWKLRARYQNLTPTQRNNVLELLSVAALISRQIENYFRQNKPDKAGTLALEAIRHKVPGIMSTQVTKSINQCLKTGCLDLAETLILGAIRQKITDITVAQVTEWISQYFKVMRPDKAGTLALEVIRQKLPDITATQITEWISQCCKASRQDKAGAIILEAIRQKIPDITVIQVIQAIDQCFNTGHSDAAEYYTLEAIRLKFPGINDAQVMKWISKFFNVGRPNAAGNLALESIKQKIPNITVMQVKQTVTQAIDQCFKAGWYYKAGTLALQALRQKISGINDTQIRQAIDQCFNEGWYYKAGILALQAFRLKIPGINDTQIRQAIDQCFNKGWYYKAGILALQAFRQKIPGINDAQIRQAIDQCFKTDKWQDGLKSFAAINEITGTKNETSVLEISGKLESFLRKNNLLDLAANPVVLDLAIYLEPDTLFNIISKQNKLLDIVTEKNEQLEDGRRLDMKNFIARYGTSLIALESIMPGTLDYLIDIALKAANIHTIKRFLENNQNFLDEPLAVEAVLKLIQRLVTTHIQTSRRDFRLDNGIMFNLMGSISAGIDSNCINEVIKEVNSFDQGMNKLHDLDRRIKEVILEKLAKDLGIKDGCVNPQAYSKIYFPYASRLVKGLQTVIKKSKSKGEMFKALLKAMLEDRFDDFISNPDQTDPIGQAIAKHNAAIRKQMKKLGIDTERWLATKTSNRLSDEVFTYYEDTIIEYDPVADSLAVSDYLRRVLSLKLVKQNDRQRIIDYLKKQGISVKLEDNRWTIFSGNKKDLTVLLANDQTLSGLMEIIKSIIDQPAIKNDPSTLESINHCRERIDTLSTRLTDERYKQQITGLRKTFRAKIFNRYPGTDLFMGDYTDCCLAMSSGLYPEAMAERLIDQALSVIEIIDEQTEKTMACAWLYIAADGSLVIQNMEIAAEYERSKPLMNRIGQEMINYALALKKHINAKRLLIGIPGHGKYFDDVGIIQTKYKQNQVAYGQEKLGGYYNQPYYLDSAEKPFAYLVPEPVLASPHLICA